MEYFQTKKGNKQPYGAEILAAADTENQGLKNQNNSADLGQRFNMYYVIIVHSKSLYDTITSLHENREHHPRRTVKRICDSFAFRDL